MVYETRNRKLIVNDKLVIDNLSPNEHKLLMLLGNNEWNNLEVLAREIYKDKIEKPYYQINSVRGIKYNLLKKVNLSIKTKAGFGFKLENVISFI